MYTITRTLTFFYPFRPFFRAKKFLPGTHHGNEVVPPARSSTTTLQEIYLVYIPSAWRTTFLVKAIASSVIQLFIIVLLVCSLALGEMNHFLFSFLAFLRAFRATRSQLRVHESTSRVASRCPRLPAACRTPYPHTPHQAHRPDSRAVIPCEMLYVAVLKSVRGWVFSHHFIFVHPHKIALHRPSTTLQHLSLKSR